jgi:hypothetical protein
MIRLMCCSILVFCLSASGKISVGGDVTYTLGNTAMENKPASTASSKMTYISNNVTITPYVGIPIGEVLEIAPFLGWNLNQSSVKSDTPDSSANYKTSTIQNGLHFGARLFFHLIEKELLGVSLGPELGDKMFEPSYTSDSPTYTNGMSEFFQNQVWLGCPVNIDLHLNDIISARLSITVLQILYETTHQKFINVVRTEEYSSFRINLQSIVSPSLGFYLTF